MRLLNVVLMSISSPSLKNSREKNSVITAAIHKLQDSLRQTLAFSDEDIKLDGPRYLNEDQVKEFSLTEGLLSCTTEFEMLAWETIYKYTLIKVMPVILGSITEPCVARSPVSHTSYLT